jgi:hypothetical protein
MQLLKCLVAAAIVALLLGIGAGPASAHRVRLYCSLDEGRLCCRSWFSRHSPAQKALVVVRDKAGKKVASGRTGPKGRVCFTGKFKLPLTAEVNAGAGHVAKFVIEPDE